MESKLNKKIREILEMFGINPSEKVIGKWYLIGHLKNLIEEEINNEDVKNKAATKRYLFCLLSEKDGCDPSDDYLDQEFLRMNQAINRFKSDE